MAPAGARRSTIRFALAGLLVVSLVGVLATGANALTLRGTVSDVVDGDTIKVVSRGFETPVRLIGIDTPETRHPSKPVQCFGAAASARAKRLLPPGQRVSLVTDPTQDTRDRYGRLLAYVYKPGKKGPRGSVNFALMGTGYAKVYVYGGVRFRHAVPFFRAQHRARKAKRGLWGPPCNGNTTKPDPSAGTPAPPSPPTSGGGCDPNYAGACVPVYPPDVNCGDIPDRNFRVVGTDVHNFDVDHDGIACEE
jgi:micrococcal nuclease